MMKQFNEMQNVGKAKYVVNHHDGVKRHADGSPFFDVSIFSSRSKKDGFVKELRKRGFIDSGGSSLARALRTSFAAPASGRSMLSDTLGRKTGMLVWESPKVPRVSIQTPLGVALAVSGAALTLEALIALFSSDDQTTWATVFRIFRLGLGGGMLVWVAASSQ